MMNPALPAAIASEYSDGVRRGASEANMANILLSVVARPPTPSQCLSPGVRGAQGGGSGHVQTPSTSYPKGGGAPLSPRIPTSRVRIANCKSSCPEPSLLAGGCGGNAGMHVSTFASTPASGVVAALRS